VEEPFLSAIECNGVYDVRQKEIHTTEPLVLEPSAFDVATGIENLKRHKSTSIDHISAELIKTGGRKIRSEIHKLLISFWHKEELIEEWKQSIIVSIHKKGDETDCINYRGMSLLLTTYKTLSNILLYRLTPYTEEIIGDHEDGFRRSRHSSNTWEKNRNTMKQCFIYW
jgi:hypothetical protein